MAKSAAGSQYGRSTRRRAVCVGLGLIFAVSLGWGNLGAQTSKTHSVPQPEPLQITISGPKEAVVDRPMTFQVHVVNTGDKASDKLELVIGHFSQKTKTLAAARGIEEETVTVLVAKKGLSTGEIIRKPEDAFIQKEISKESAPKNALTKFEEVKGRQLKIPRREGDTIIHDDLHDDKTPNIMSTLPAGHRAVGIRVSAEQAAAGFAAVPLSRVDIVSTVRDKDGDTVSKILLQDVLVLASGQHMGRDEAGKAMPFDIVTVALLPEDALKVETARSRGSISLLLRPFGEKTKSGKVDDKKNDAAPNGLADLPASRVEIAVPIREGDDNNRAMLKAVLQLANTEQTPTIRAVMSNVEQIRLPLASLAPKERRTLTLTLTPRRIGLFKIELAIDRAMPSLAVAATAGIEVKFDPKTPSAEFLPPQPRNNAASKSRLPRNLSEVPEVSFQEPTAKTVKAEEVLDRLGHVIDGIIHVNEKKQDAFMEELLSKRADLAGLSFAMGDACRLREEPSRQFGLALAHLRSLLRGTRTFTDVSKSAPNESMMQTFRRLSEGDDERQNSAEAEDAIPARIAALMQVLTPETPQLRQGLIKYLAGVPHAEATRALAKLSIFSEEEEIRRAALEALKTRREKDYSGILVQGLSYPWPAVARRSAEAITKLERTDLIPRLLEVLERPDPRAPQSHDRDGKKTTVVRELVRINHHRNCLLCHAPARSDDPLVMAVLAAEMPVPNLPLPIPSSGGYGSSNAIPEHAVRVDVTYLRQDFSVKLPVAGAHPWPEMQRFDFVVRTREVTDEDAKAYSVLLQSREPGVMSPYHQAALFALRELTGRDTEPTAAAWRKLLAQAKGADH